MIVETKRFLWKSYYDHEESVPVRNNEIIDHTKGPTFT